jgi:peptidoglycan/LPS O-acetylase OafA/YrhL
VFRDDLGAFLPSYRIIDRTVFSFIGGFIILEQTFANNSFFKFANLKRMSSLGKYTYGMYCLQFVGILIVLKTAKIIGISDSFSKVMLIDPIISLLVIIGLAYVSYHLFEKHFLKLKEKFK